MILRNPENITNLSALSQKRRQVTEREFKGDSGMSPLFMQLLPSTFYKLDYRKSYITCPENKPTNIGWKNELGGKMNWGEK